MSPMPPDDVLTPRLALIAITPAMLASEKAADGQLGSLTRCTIPLNWPPVDWEPHVFDILLTQYTRCPLQVAWHRYIALSHPDGSRTLIGALGAFWRETSPAACEIGYTVLPPHEGQGLATEAALALLNLIRHDRIMPIPVTSVIARTFPHLAASLRVLEKCGFTYDGRGEEAGTVRYLLRL